MCFSVNEFFIMNFFHLLVLFIVVFCFEFFIIVDLLLNFFVNEWLLLYFSHYWFLIYFTVFKLSALSDLRTSSSLSSPEIVHSNERFFLNPMFVPSGVSMGHNLPKWVECSSLASKFSCDALNGLTTLCKCDKFSK